MAIIAAAPGLARYIDIAESLISCLNPPSGRLASGWQSLQLPLAAKSKNQPLLTE